MPGVLGGPFVAWQSRVGSRSYEAPMSDKSIRAEVATRGYAFLSAFEPHRSSLEVIEGLGRIDTGTANPLRVLRPQRREHSTPNVYSGNFGLAEYPLHTDLAHWYLPPRYFLLRCIAGAEVPTFLVDGRPIVAAVGEDLLRRALVRPRRAALGGRPLFPLLRRGCPDREGSLLRWDELFVEAASSAGRQGSAAMQHELRSATREAIVLRGPGDTLVVDNWRMIHGRGAIPPTSMHRAVERAYLAEIT